MPWVAPTLSILALACAIVLLAAVVRVASRTAPRVMRPLLAAVASLNSIGLVLVVERWLSESGWTHLSAPASASGLSIVGDTAIVGFKLAWLLFFAAFLRRLTFEPDIGTQPSRRVARVVTGLVILLVAAGWAEYLWASSRAVLDKLQIASDYLLVFAMLGLALHLRTQAATRVGRPAARALVVLSGLSAVAFLALGLWWIVGGTAYRLAPDASAGFVPLWLASFNGALSVWVVRFSRILARPEAARFSARPVTDELAARWGVSRREAEVIELVGQGLSNRDIADQLCISLATVKKHLNVVFQKTGVANRVQLVRLFSEPDRLQAREAEAERLEARRER